MADAPLLEDFELGEMRPDERNFVLDSWMRSGKKWRRVDIYRCLERGQVRVARSDDGEYIFGWLCSVGDVAAYGFVRDGYREIGVMRALWDAAGRPSKLMPPRSNVGHAVLRRLKGRCEE